jgi:hypothetical protein
VSIPNAGETQRGVVYVDNSVNPESNNPVSGKGVAEYVAENGGGVVDTEIDKKSTNAVQNKAIAKALDEAVALAKRDLYIVAGAEYNDTDKVIKRTAFWGEKVDHEPGCYYLNGLGDISEDEMAHIYNYKDAMYWIMAGVNCTRMLQAIESPRTLFAPKDYKYAMKSTVKDFGYHFCNKIEVVKFVHGDSWKSKEDYIVMSENAFSKNDELKVVDTFRQSTLKVIEAPKLTHIRAILTNSFSVSKSSSITKDSVLYMINNFVVPKDNATSNTPYTITLHPDVFTKCIEGGDWYEDINPALVAKNKSLSAKKYSLNLGA